MNNTSNTNVTATAGALNLPLEGQESLDGRFMVSLTPTSSVAVMGLASMRYDQAPALSQQQQQYLSALSSHASTGGNSPAASAIGLRRSLLMDGSGSPFGPIPAQIIPTAIARTLTIAGTTAAAVQRQGHGLAANPISRYLSSLDVYAGSGGQQSQQSQQSLRLHQLGQLQQLQQQLSRQGAEGQSVPGTVVQSMGQLPAYLAFGSPIATTATTPAIF
ncbi:hypothetical protein LPJ56_006542, partial [Coemansia sp. RSA 2599]